MSPRHHAGTFINLLPSLLFGATVIERRKFDPEEFLRLTEKERINWAFIAPTILQRILALPDEVKRRYDLSSMRSLICAAAPCPPKVKKNINELFIQQGCKEGPFIEYYGSAESGVETVLTTSDYIQNPKRYESVGKVRLAELKIYDDEKGEWCPPNKEGRLLTRTMFTPFLRYKGTPEKLKDAFKVVDGKEWFDAGLFGYLDEDDFLYLTVREKEIIISGGVNIYPNEIEEIILKNPKVLDAGVIRAPDKDLGEVPAAVVQLKEGEKATEEEIIDWCKKEGLYGYKVPRIVEFVEELPRHIDGKLIKRDLEKKYWEDKEIKRRG